MWFGHHTTPCVYWPNQNVLYSQSFTYDKLGRIKTNTVTDGGIIAVHSYEYDDRGRLEEHKVDGTVVGSWTYDANSNRQVTTTGAQILSLYDDQDRLLTHGDLHFAYTATGDLLSKTDSVTNDVTQYTYDEMGNLLQVDLPNNDTITYLYDARNRRVGKSVNNVFERGWLYGDQLSPVAEVDANGTVISRFVYGVNPYVPAYMVRDGERYRFITDHLGSVLKVVNVNDGTVVQELAYDVWGVVQGDTNPQWQPFAYAGGLYEPATQLVRYGARDYDASTGRWTSKEPLGFAAATNFYVYVGGDPVNSIDPTGNIPIIPFILNLLFDVAFDVAMELWATDGNWGCINAGFLARSVLNSAGMAGLGAFAKGVKLAQAGTKAAKAAKGGLKRGPKPFGVGPHNQKIREVADSVTDGDVIAGGQRVGLPEAVIRTTGGLKGSRRPDILVRRPDGSLYGINVGKQSRRTGAPIKREVQAINDLEEFGDLPMHFVPYN